MNEKSDLLLTPQGISAVIPTCGSGKSTYLRDLFNSYSDPYAPYALYQRLISRSWGQKHHSAIERIAGTVWVLWREQQDRLWGVVHDWSNKGPIYARCALAVIETGINSGDVKVADAWKRIEGALVSDDAKCRNAAIGLLPAFPVEWLFEASENLVASEKDTHLTATKRLVHTLITYSPERMLEQLIRWAHEREDVVNRVVCETMGDISFPPGMTAQFYRNVGALTAQLSATIDSTDGRRILKRVAQQCRDRSSQINDRQNWRSRKK